MTKPPEAGDETTLPWNISQHVQGPKIDKTQKRQVELSLEQVLENQTAYKNNLKRIATKKHVNIQARDQAFMNVATEKPAVKEKYRNLMDLKEKYSECVDALQKTSWREHCKERGLLGMTKPCGDEKISLEEFRTFWNAAVDEVALTIGKEAGCPNAFWGACGTVSALSDVDTGIISKGLSPSDANIYITARNAVHTCSLEGHSGIQLDTEPYMPHSARHNTLGSLSGAPQAHARYIACEKANVVLQYYISLNEHPKEYQQAKNTYLKGILDPVHREGMKIVFAQMETLMDYIEVEVTDEILLENSVSKDELNKMAKEDKKKKAAKIKHDNPQAYKLARENVISRMRTQVGEAFKKVDNKIATLKKQLSVNQRNDSIQNEITKQLDDLNNTRNEMLSVMNILQDKGTNSQAEGKITLLHEGGQMYARAQREAVIKIATEDKKQTGVTALLLKKGGGTVSEVLYKRKKRKELQPTGYETPTAETLSIAAQEENSQRKHEFYNTIRNAITQATKLEQNEVAMKALGSKQAKYAERTTGNSFRALQQKIKDLKGQKKPIPLSLIRLKHRAKNLMDTSKSLLMCMRKDSLGAHATKELLAKVVIDDMKAGNFDDLVSIQAKVRKVVDLFEPGGREDGKTMEKFEKMNVMVREMIDLELIDYRDAVEMNIINKETGHTKIHLKPKNLELRKILEARVGYSIEYPEHSNLIPLHDEALKITCKSLKLDTIEAAKNFDKKVDQLNQDLENLFIDNCWMPKVTQENAEKLNFIEILMKARENFEDNIKVG